LIIQKYCFWIYNLVFYILSLIYFYEICPAITFSSSKYHFFKYLLFIFIYYSHNIFKFHHRILILIKIYFLLKLLFWSLTIDANIHILFFLIRVDATHQFFWCQQSRSVFNIIISFCLQFFKEFHLFDKKIILFLYALFYFLTIIGPRSVTIF
jgi:hypothetical protein